MLKWKVSFSVVQLWIVSGLNSVFTCPLLLSKVWLHSWLRRLGRIALCLQGRDQEFKAIILSYVELKASLAYGKPCRQQHYPGKQQQNNCLCWSVFNLRISSSRSFKNISQDFVDWYSFPLGKYFPYTICILNFFLWTRKKA